MNDERLDTGHRSLEAGRLAIDTRDLASAREAFEAAVLQFAGPELKMGEGHALRGLARVAALETDLERAEDLLNGAVLCFRTVRTLLDAIDSEGLAHEQRMGAMEAEALAQVDLGELCLRGGRVQEAVEARDWARAAFDGLGARPAEAAVYALTGHVALRTGELDEAQTAYRQMLAIHERFEETRGQALALGFLAEALRLDGRLTEAEDAQKRVLPLARAMSDLALEARALSGLALLARQSGEHEAAMLANERVLEIAEALGDEEMKGFAELQVGDLLARLGRGQPVHHLRRAAEHLTQMGAEHGLGTVLLHTAEHALRVGRPDLALAAGEGAWRIYRTLDPIRGVSLALRVLVRAMPSYVGPEATLLVATVREDLVAGAQPHAGAVADHYRELVGADDLVRVESMPPVERAAHAEELLGAILEAVLPTFQLRRSDLGTRRGALILLDALAVAHDERDLTELDPSALEALPGEDAFYVLSVNDLLPGESA